MMVAEGTIFESSEETNARIQEILDEGTRKTEQTVADRGTQSAPVAPGVVWVNETKGIHILLAIFWFAVCVGFGLYLSYMEYKNMPGRFVVAMFCVSTLVLAIHCFLVGFVSSATIILEVHRGATPRSLEPEKKAAIIDEVK